VTAPTAPPAPAVTELHFRAVGPQIDLISCPIGDVFYGGARGGMKSYGIILDFVAHADRYGRAARGILFRRSYDELVEIERICHEILGGVWTWKASGRTWTSPKSATLRLRYLDRDEDADRYQGHQYTRVYVDEAGAFASPRPIDKLFGALRSPEGVPVGRRLTGNPGGPGHQWLKQRYVDPAAPWTPFEYQPQPALQPDWHLSAVFIPATLDDNPFLMQHDPEYEGRLAAAGGAELFRAWRYGDWDITGGAALEIVARKHIVPPPPRGIPDYWELFGAFDWGYAHWWVFAWFAVNEDGRVFCMDTIRGRRMRDPEIIADIKRRVPLWQRLGRIVAGHDCWNKRNMDEDAPTTEERFAAADLYLSKASTDRPIGLRNFREYLAWKGTAPDGSDDDPRFVWVDTPGNRRAVAAIQAIVTDPDNPEDALKVNADSDTGAGGDDDYDCTRYGLASRPLKAKAPWPEKRTNAWAPDLLAHEADESRRDRAPRPKRRQVLPEAF
jgi:hypothetical protein